MCVCVCIYKTAFKVFAQIFSLFCFSDSFSNNTNICRLKGLVGIFHFSSNLSVKRQSLQNFFFQIYNFKVHRQI